MSPVSCAFSYLWKHLTEILNRGTCSWWYSTNVLSKCVLECTATHFTKITYTDTLCPLAPLQGAVPQSWEAVSWAVGLILPPIKQLTTLLCISFLRWPCAAIKRWPCLSTGLYMYDLFLLCTCSRWHPRIGVTSTEYGEAGKRSRCGVNLVGGVGVGRTGTLQRYLQI